MISVDWLNDGNSWYVYLTMSIMTLMVLAFGAYKRFDPLPNVAIAANPFSL